MMQVSKTKKGKYDLEERTARFAEQLIDVCKKAPKNAVATPIIDQLIRAGTSIGANYCEANGASSKKEARETKYWLRLLAKTAEELKGECRELWQEAQEFNLIFSKIAASSK